MSDVSSTPGKKNAQQKNVVLAAGGTGGHLFPAEALAHELKTRGITPVLITDKRDTRFLSDAWRGINVEVIHTGRSGASLWHKARGAIQLGMGYLQAKKLLKKLKPITVVGFGGYPSFPPVFAAERLNIPVILHEQNSLLGQANAMLARRAHSIATSFTEVRGISAEDQSKVIFTGNPVRASICAIRNMPYSQLQQGGNLRILVTGGSQGAGVFSSVVPEAIARLPEAIRQRIRIDQQCRKENLEATRKRYQEMGVSADISDFFNDMPSRLASCHLVICRAGASTVAELTVAGRPSILVPYAHAKDDHQTINANALEESGGAWLIPEAAFTPEMLAGRLEHFMTLPESLSDAADRARALGQPDAVNALANCVSHFLSDHGKENHPDATHLNVRDESTLDRLEANA